ncbi:MAG: aminoacyl-tRNA hydrolase [Flavobacteriaceae bacterium]|nr:aminoacyl-tRNA hydrolase [Bacteroidia bacterium]NNF73961.1 aminoacyl-tRNA hydrolase [Flavobacteriaceae bacterium]NNK72485.1 aminoacyl-tRNA hydrolase [Flavobacteriaceae bacterium]
MNVDGLISELQLKAVRSSGPGGQHVNKVSTKIKLNFDLKNSQYLSKDEKTILMKSLAKRLSKDGIISLQCAETRSQIKNKEIIINRFLEMIKKGLEIPKKRKKSKIPRQAVEKRLEKKRRTSEKKEGRKKPGMS